MGLTEEKFRNRDQYVFDMAVEDLQIMQGLYRTRLSSQLTRTAKF
jgi:hypothetical protein